MTTALTKPRRQRLPGTTIGPLGPSIHVLFQEHDDADAVVTKFYCCLTVTRDCNGETKLSFADDHIGPDNERCARTIEASRVWCSAGYGFPAARARSC